MKNTNTNNTIEFGDIFYAELKGEGSVQTGIRPVIIAQNNIGNRFSRTVEVIPCTTKIEKAAYMPTHVQLPANDITGLRRDSVALAEQTSTINSCQLIRKLGHLDNDQLRRVGSARQIQSPFFGKYAS